MPFIAALEKIKALYNFMYVIIFGRQRDCNYCSRKYHGGVLGLWQVCVSSFCHHDNTCETHS